MPTTLTYDATTLALPDDMLWPDEYDWRAVEQRTVYSITGALIVDAAAKLAGRTITLDGSHTWVARSVVDTLLEWAALPLQTFTLAYRGVNHTVIFDHAAAAIEARPNVDYADPDATDVYALTLRFLKV